MAALTTSVALVSTWKHLNDDRTLAVKPNSASREREAVVDVTFDDGTYAAGGPIVDLSVIRGFTKVYSCEILHVNAGVVLQFTPGSADAAALGKLKAYGVDFDGTPSGIKLLTELATGATLLDSKVARVRIRGV